MKAAKFLLLLLALGPPVAFAGDLADPAPLPSAGDHLAILVVQVTPAEVALEESRSSIVVGEVQLRLIYVRQTFVDTSRALAMTADQSYRAWRTSNVICYVVFPVNRAVDERAMNVVRRPRGHLLL